MATQPSPPIRPPVLLLALGGVAYVTQTFVKPISISQLVGLPQATTTPVGWAVFAAGLGTFAAAVLKFRSEGTTVAHDSPTTKLVESGVFGVSRNPIYLAMVLTLLGLGVATDNAWLVDAAAVQCVYIHSAVIPLEEAFLRDRFGAEYESYCGRVPRWLLLC